MRELKKYRLRPSRRPKKHDLLSGVVRVQGLKGPGYAAFSFDESFVDAVGKELPHGLMPSNPAYLKFLYMPGYNIWRLFAMYLREERGTLLWETPQLPPWVQKVVYR